MGNYKLSAFAEKKKKSKKPKSTSCIVTELSVLKKYTCLCIFSIILQNITSLPVGKQFGGGVDRVCWPKIAFNDLIVA